jgi:3-hydroxyisobutyrate dehydrogenase-like beta-hydroxyacid dehydrogenase
VVGGEEGGVGGEVANRVEAVAKGVDTEMTTLKNSGSKVMPHNMNMQEPCVKFVIKDTTDTNWQASRYNYSLPLSTAVADLYSAVAKEAGLCVCVCVCVCVSVFCLP